VAAELWLQLHALQVLLLLLLAWLPPPAVLLLAAGLSVARCMPHHCLALSPQHSSAALAHN
jgi:hypothetical protein